MKVVAKLKCRPTSCADLECFQPGLKTGGPYRVYPGGDGYPLVVSCEADVDGGGWMVLQRRLDGRVDFARDWDSYRRGFGQRGARSELWLGNVQAHRVTNA